jgi:riboflavin kinase/FMN adenylyltransferase
MQILRAPNYSIQKESVVAFGKFDGIHKGHQKLINVLCNEAKADNKISVVYTFITHPKLIFSEEKIELLTTNDEKEKLIEKLGVDVLVFEKFNKTFANMSPEKFVREVLVKKLCATKVVMGTNSTFGKDSKGNIDTMKMLGAKYGFEVVEVELLKENGKIISSTNIRNELKRSLV